VIATFQEPSYAIEEGILDQVCSELSSMAAIPITVTLSVTSGSALESVDFTIPSPSITFQAGSVLSCTDIMITDDSLLEDSEFFTLALNSSNPFVQTSDTATVTIPNGNSKQSSLLYHFMMISLCSFSIQLSLFHSCNLPSQYQKAVLCKYVPSCLVKQQYLSLFPW
jgi:hypothetical protein